jgi:hypothetical protein
LKEESVPEASNELLFSFIGLAVSARGPVAFFIAAAVSILIVAVAWRLIARKADD